MRVNKYSSFQWLILFLNPLLSLITSIFLLLKNKQNTFVLAITLAIFFIYMPLMYDTSSNFYATKQLFTLNIKNYLDIRLYNLIPYYFQNILNLDFMFSILIYTASIMYIWFYIFKYYANLRTDNYMLYYMICFAFSSLIYRSIMDLNRFYLATSIVLFIFFILEINKLSKKYTVFLCTLTIFALLLHPAILVLLIFYPVAKKIVNFRFYVFFPILLLLLGSFAGPISRYLMNLPILNTIDFLMNASGYVDDGNKWGQNSVRGYEFILRTIEIILIFFIYYKSLLLLKINNSIMLRYIFLLMGLVLFLLSFKSLYERYSIAFFLFSLFIIYFSILNKNKKDYLLLMILFLFFLRFILLNIVWYGKIFTTEYNTILPNHSKKIEMTFKPFYYSTFFLLDIKTFGYSNNYILKESTRGREYLQRNKKSSILKNQQGNL